MLERFDLALFDYRKRGRNPFHAAEPHDYPRFARDSAAVHRAIAGARGRKTTIGVFHSMSAIAALLASFHAAHGSGEVSFHRCLISRRTGPLEHAAPLDRSAGLLGPRQRWGVATNDRASTPTARSGIKPAVSAPAPAGACAEPANAAGLPCLKFKGGA